jgi:hypothetical protein
VAQKVLITHHAVQRARERGTDSDQIQDVLASGALVSAHSGRLAKAKVYEFNKLRKGISYSHKRVEVCYVEEGDATIVVTVYVFYGTWERL